MSKKKEAVFLDVYKGLDGKLTWSPTRKEKQEDGTEKEVDNIKEPYVKGVNRKAKRIIAAQNRKRA